MIRAAGAASTAEAIQAAETLADLAAEAISVAAAPAIAGRP